MQKDESFVGRPTVLVVEDNPANLKYLTFLLRKLRLITIATATAEEALEILKNTTVDGMLVDVNLGTGMSGLDLMEELRTKKQFAATPMIAVTAYFSRGLHKELLDKGFSDYLAKPFTLEDLRKLMERNLRGKGSA